MSCANDLANAEKMINYEYQNNNSSDYISQVWPVVSSGDRYLDRPWYKFKTIENLPDTTSSNDDL